MGKTLSKRCFNKDPPGILPEKRRLLDDVEAQQQEAPLLVLLTIIRSNGWTTQEFWPCMVNPNLNGIVSSIL